MRNKHCLLTGLVGCVLFLSSPHAAEPETVRVRVSVKRVLSDRGSLPRGTYGSRDSIVAAIRGANVALELSGARLDLVLTEVVDVDRAFEFYTLPAHNAVDLEQAALRDPERLEWRSDAINLYVVDQLEGAGGVCSFPAFGPHREVIVINSRNILGGSEGWLHEIGHYFNLIHTHDGDRVPDTIPDPRPPGGDCVSHDANLLDLTMAAGARERDVLYLLHNVMSYHCDPRVLTPLQVIRMRNALFEYRAHVLEEIPEDAAPFADVRLPVDVESGNVALRGETVSVELDGRFSHDGDGGTQLSFGDDPRRRHLTYYFRTAFEVEDVATVEELRLNLRRDDGAVVYVNGREVARSNLPVEEIKYETLALAAIAGAEENRLAAFTVLETENLRSGRNVVAVEVHQVSGSSSDLAFALEVTDQDGRELVPMVNVWRYNASGEDLGAVWRETAFDDSEWALGAAPLGYGDVKTDGSRLLWNWELLDDSGGAQFESRPLGWELGRSGIGYGDDDDVTVLADMRNRYISVYMTHPFQLESPEDYRSLELDVTYDDGFAAYLNGVEIGRRNLVPGAGPETGTPEPIEPTRWVITLDDPSTLLRHGRNVLSIEVHNHILDNSDLTLHPVFYGVLGDGATRTALIPSRALWYFRKGSAGAPPSNWTDPEFDPGGRQTRVTFSRPGAYRVRLTVDDGSPPFQLASTEVELRVTNGGFLRGDCNSDQRVDISDAAEVLRLLFQSPDEPRCADACDVNDDEALQLTDAIFLLNVLFNGEVRLPQPFPVSGSDPNGDALGCGDGGELPLEMI